MTTPTRTGKIARLPHNLRHELNQRLQNGQPSRQIAAWLNARPDVQAILKEHFHSEPIRQQNISRWTQGGYQDWLLRQEALEIAHPLTDDAHAFAAETPTPLPAALTHWFALRCALATRQVAAAEGPEAWKRLRQFGRDAIQLHRTDLLAQRQQLQREKFAFQQDQVRAKAEALREQTDADHERWALHPDNQDRLWQSLCTAYPDEYKYEDDEEDEAADKSPTQREPTQTNPLGGHRSVDAGQKAPAPTPILPISPTGSITPTPQSQSGLAASLQNAVTLSEVEGPHPFAGPSPASPHAEIPEHSSPSSLSPSHSSHESESQPIFCHTTGTYIHYDDDEAAPSPSAPSPSPCHPDPTPLSSEAAVHAKLDTFDAELRILRRRIEDLPPPPPPHKVYPSDSAKATAARILWPKAVARLGVDGAIAASHQI